MSLSMPLKFLLLGAFFLTSANAWATQWSCQYLTDPTSTPKKYKSMCISKVSLDYCGPSAFDSSCKSKNPTGTCASATLKECPEVTLTEGAYAKPICQKPGESYFYCYQTQVNSDLCSPYTTSTCELIPTAPVSCKSASKGNFNCSSGGGKSSMMSAIAPPKTEVVTETIPKPMPSPTSWSCKYNYGEGVIKDKCIAEANLQFCGGLAFNAVCDKMESPPASCAKATLIVCPSQPIAETESESETEDGKTPKQTLAEIEEQIAEQQALAMQAMMIELKKNHTSVVAAFEANPTGDVNGGSKLYDNLGLSNKSADALSKKNISYISGDPALAGKTTSNTDSEYTTVKGLKMPKGKKLDSALGGDSDISSSSEGSSKAYNNKSSKKGSKAFNNAWLDAMSSGSSREGFVEKLSRDIGLREQLKKMLEDKKRALAEGDGNSAGSETIAFLEDALKDAEALSKDKSFADLAPMSASEAFAMDANETREAIEGMMGEMDDGNSHPNGRALASASAGSEQFYANGSLFERVKLAYGRSRGKIKNK